MIYKYLFALVTVQVCFLFHGLFAEEHFKCTYLEHISTLKNLEQENPKFIVLFSGVPGMGKTTIAKYLESELQGICISSDEARALLRKNYAPEIQFNMLNDQEIGLENYLKFIIKNLEKTTLNHLIILDRSIDGIERETIDLAKSMGYQIFFIRLILSKKEVIRRLALRETDASVHQERLRRINKWFDEYTNTKILAFDFILNREDPNQECLLQQLRQEIVDRLCTYF